MAHHNQSGGRNLVASEHDRSSWRPQDQPLTGARRRDAADDLEYRPWRVRDVRDDERRPGEGDARRWEGGGGSDVYAEDRDLASRQAERYGQGHGGYGAGRYGDDRPQPPGGRGEVTASAGSFEDRSREIGADDRLAGRRSGYWQDRIGYDLDHYGGYAGRDFDTERRGLARSGHGYEERMSYPPGSYRRGMGGAGVSPSGALRDTGPEPHVHRGTGPHRGKGPAGYQRSDERIRELVCESLTDDDQVDASHIEVAVSHGEVMLSGTVEDRRAKRDAEDCAYSVAGVRDVQNLLRVARDDRPFPRGTDQTSPGSPGPGSPGSGSPGSGSPGRSEPEAPVQDRKYRA